MLNTCVVTEFVDSAFFCQKSCQLLSYKSDTCTSFLLHLGVASNGCKRTRWKKNSYGIYYMYTQQQRTSSLMMYNVNTTLDCNNVNSNSILVMGR